MSSELTVFLLGTYTPECERILSALLPPHHHISDLSEFNDKVLVDVAGSESKTQIVDTMEMFGLNPWSYSATIDCTSKYISDGMLAMVDWDMVTVFDMKTIKTLVEKHKFELLFYHSY
jgi:hypothetical protein